MVDVFTVDVVEVLETKNNFGFLCPPISVLKHHIEVTFNSYNHRPVLTLLSLSSR